MVPLSTALTKSHGEEPTAAIAQALESIAAH
jgi:hypothetical protein